MKRAFFYIILIFLFSITIVYANPTFNINLNSIFDKKNNLENDIKKTINNQIDFEFVTNENKNEEILTLSKNLTYLLLDINNSKTAIEYYNLYKTYQNNIHEEAKNIDDSFKKIEQLNLQYNFINNIKTYKLDNDYISMINLTNGYLKSSTTDLNIYYYFKKEDNKYKLYNLTYETSLDIVNFYNNLNTNKIYNSPLTIFNKNVLGIDNEISKKIINNNKKNIVLLQSYNNNELINTANGFYIQKNQIITSLSFFKAALRESQNLIITNAETNKIIDYRISEIIPEKNIIILKTDTENTYVQIEENYKENDQVLMINSINGSILSIDDNINLIMPINNSEGSPIFNINGNVIGMVNSSIKGSLTSCITGYDLKNIEKKINQKNSITFEELKNKYYNINVYEENIKNNIPLKKWEQYKKIGDLENSIKLELIQANMLDEIITLKYYNKAFKYINSFKFANEFISNIKDEEYVETLNTNNKCIYENINNKIIIFGDYEYLFIVLVKK